MRKGKNKMSEKEKNNLRMWQKRLESCRAAYESEYRKMDEREQLYRGRRSIRPVSKGDRTRTGAHIYNITAELIESQVDSTVPRPKVTAKRSGDEPLAKLIEDMLREEIKLGRFTSFNDMMERTVPLQGGGFCLVEWDSSYRSHDAAGRVAVSCLHPKQFIPQAGVYTGIEDMDYFIISVPQTAEGIKRRYDVSVERPYEDSPSVRSPERQEPSDELVTQYIAYYKNGEGGIGAFSWVCDTVLYDLPDCQARRLSHCTVCGAAEPVSDGRPGSGECPYCGSKKFREENCDTETLYTSVLRSDGTVIPARYESEELYFTPEGETRYRSTVKDTEIPYYKPGTYPVVLFRNVSLYGRLLGDSDADKIADHQNTVNRIEAKIIDKLTKAGSYITLPDEASVRFDSEDMKVIRPGSAAAKAMIDVYSLEGNVSQDMAYLDRVYNEAKQSVGITDSFLGRHDETAISGKAKQIAINQAAGRFQSKRRMKSEAYAKLFELIFKFRLAYTDEPLPVLSRDGEGKISYENFNRYDFLKKNEAGEWYWNDDFIFEAELSGSDESRETLWEQNAESLRMGAYGDPSDIKTLIMFWSKMELMHYPGATETKSWLESRLAEQAEESGD